MSMPRRPYLTTLAHEVFALAHDLASQLGHEEVTPTHLAVCFFRVDPNIGTGALFFLGVPLEAVEREL